MTLGTALKQPEAAQLEEHSDEVPAAKRKGCANFFYPRLLSPVTRLVKEKHNELHQNQPDPIDKRQSHVILKGGSGQVPVGLPVFKIGVGSVSYTHLTLPTN